MFKRIIVGYDGGEQARDAAALAKLIGASTGAELVAACVWGSLGQVPQPGFGKWDEFVRDEARKTAARAGEEFRAEAVEGGSPSRGLHDLAEREGADLVVVGSSHRGKVGRALAGTVGVGLLHGSPCAVAVAPAGYRDAQSAELRLIGVGYDGQPEAEHALAGAIELARATGADLRIITVARPAETGVEGKGYTQAGRAELAAAIVEIMQEVLDRGVAKVPNGIEAAGVLVTHSQDPMQDQEDVDLMVMGSRGYGPIRRVLLGSNSARLLRDAPCPSIVFPRGAKEPASGGPDRSEGIAAGAER